MASSAEPVVISHGDVAFDVISHGDVAADVISHGDVSPDLLPVVRGLTSRRRYVPDWYRYDTRGSQMCEELLQNSTTYNVWRHEYSILQAHVHDIAGKVPSPAVLVELGSGASSKTRLVIEAMLEKQRSLTFLPVDAATEFMEDCCRVLERDYPGLTVEPFGGLYVDGVRHAAARQEDKLMLFLGNSFGNIPIHEHQKMLQDIRAHLSDQDRFVLGVDMTSDREVLSQAYGAQWVPVWRDNLFCRLNKDFGGDLKAEKFEYKFDFVENPADGDTPSYVQLSLSSSGQQRVHFENIGLDIDFKDGERIYLCEGPNTSCKWNLGQLRRLAERSGFTVDGHWTNDEATYCVICLAPAAVNTPPFGIS